MMGKKKPNSKLETMDEVLLRAVASIWEEEPEAFLSQDGLAIKHPSGKGELIRFPSTGEVSAGWVLDHIASALVAGDVSSHVVRGGEDPLFQGCERSGLLGLVREVAPAPPASRTEGLRAWARENLRGDGIPHGDEDSRGHILSEEEQAHQRWLLSRPERWQYLRDALGGASDVNVLMSGVAPPQVLSLLCADALDVFESVSVYFHFRIMDPGGHALNDERQRRLSNDMQRLCEVSDGRLSFHTPVHCTYLPAGEAGVVRGAPCDAVLFLTVDATNLMKPDCVFALGDPPANQHMELAAMEIVCDPLASIMLGRPGEAGGVQRVMDYLLQEDGLPGEHDDDWPCFPPKPLGRKSIREVAQSVFDALRRFDTTNDVRFLPIWSVHRPRARLEWCPCAEVTSIERYMGLDAVRDHVKNGRRENTGPFRVLDVGAGELRPLFVLVLALVAEGVTEIEVRAVENGFNAKTMEALHQTLMSAVVHLFDGQVTLRLAIFQHDVFTQDQAYSMGMESWLCDGHKLDLVTLVDFNVDGSPEQQVLEKEWMEQACGEDTRVLLQRHGLLRVQMEQESNLLFGDRDTVLQLISPPTQ